MVEGRPACRGCKLKKKRCPHRLPTQPEPCIGSGSDLATESQPKASTKRRRGATISNEEDATAPTAPTVSTTSSEELSSVPSDGEDETPVPKKRFQRPNPMFQLVDLGPLPEIPEIPDLNDDAMKAASSMAVHRVYARKLEDDMRQIQTSVNATLQNLFEAVDNAQTVARDIEEWIAVWIDRQ